MSVNPQQMKRIDTPGRVEVGLHDRGRSIRLPARSLARVLWALCAPRGPGLGAPCCGEKACRSAMRCHLFDDAGTLDGVRAILSLLP